MSVMELGHLLTLSSLTYLEVSSEGCHDTSRYVRPERVNKWSIIDYFITNKINLLEINYIEY